MRDPLTIATVVIALLVAASAALAAIGLARRRTKPRIRPAPPRPVTTGRDARRPPAPPAALRPTPARADPERASGRPVGPERRGPGTQTGTQTRTLARSRSTPAEHRATRGAAGEAMVRAALDGLGCRAIHDVTIPTTGGGTTQIDHVAIMGSHVTCLETKNWRGAVRATQNGDTWTVTVDGVERAADNPLGQSRYHETQMRRALGDALADVKGQVRHHVVMVGGGEIVADWRRNILDLDGLRQWVGHAGGLASDAVAEKCFDRVMRVAAEQDWGIGAFGAHPSCARSGEAWGCRAAGPGGATVH